MFIFVTVPFKGHSNVILRSAEEFASKGNKVRLIILTWSNFPVEMPTNTLLHTTLLTSNVPITSSKPTEFTWDRTNDLTGELYKLCLQWHQYDVIDWIIYDFFCPEALIVSEALRVPSVCSIPAIFPIDCIESSYHKESVLKLKPILDEISQKWNLKPMLSERLMPVSDSFYISGSQKQWLWAHPSLYENIPLTFGLFTSPIFVTRNTCNSPKIFLTKDSKNYPFDRYADQNNPMKETIYVCLGTVVTGNLWKKHAEARNLAQLVFSSVIDYVLKKRIRAIISIPGLPLPHLLVPKTHPLTEKERSERSEQQERSEKEQSEQSEQSELDSKIVRLCEENSDLIQIVNFVDQIAILNQKSTKLFITHGGGNSVSEAIDAGTPTCHTVLRRSACISGTC
jgi:hypothetical protein